MSVESIVSALKSRFPEGVGELQKPAAGDAYLTVQPAALHDVCRYLRDECGFDYLRLITGAEFPEYLASIYHLYSYGSAQALTIRVPLPKERPEAPSVVGLWPAADWLERESFDMVGIVYAGHPDLRRILLPLDWEGFPLRKDYQQPKSYHGIDNE